MGALWSSTECVTKESEGYFKVEEDSPEYKFCDKFMQVVSNDKNNYQEEFRKRFQVSPDGRISWEFWTGHKSYKSAFMKAMQEAIEIDPMETPELYTHARDIVKERLTKLKEQKGGIYAHQQAFQKWKQLRDKLKHKQGTIPIPMETSLNNKILVLMTVGVVVGSILWNIYWEIQAREEKLMTGRTA